MLRYDIANHLHVDPVRDIAVLQKFLDTLKSDMDWDKDDPKQGGYLAMGLTRYHCNLQDTLVKTLDSDVYQEQVVEQTASSGVNINSVQLSLGSGSNDSPTQIEVKVENELYHTLTNTWKKTFETQEKATSRALLELKTCRAFITKHVENAADEAVTTMGRALRKSAHAVCGVFLCGLCSETNIAPNQPVQQPITKKQKHVSHYVVCGCIFNTVGAKHLNDLKASAKQVEGVQTKALLMLAGISVLGKDSDESKCQSMLNEAVICDEEIGNYCHAAALVLSRGRAFLDSQIS